MPDLQCFFLFLVLFFLGGVILLFVMVGRILSKVGAEAQYNADRFRALKQDLAALKKLIEHLPTSESAAATRQEPGTEKSITQPAHVQPGRPLETLAEPAAPTPEPRLATSPPQPAPKRPAEIPQAAVKVPPPAVHHLPRPAIEPPTLVPPRAPSAFEIAAQEILQKIWNWIIVGEEHRPAGTSMEFAIASTWLLRLGVLILVMGMGFFLKYSIDHDYIGPLGRVGLVILAGAAQIALGMRLSGKTYRPFGLGLIGSGIATLYFAIFAASRFHQLIDPPIDFALMILVTVFAGVIASRFNAMIVAILGMLGGYGTPVMLATGAVNFPGLFTYQILLGLGVLGISLRKKWHLLNYLSFVCNQVLFFGAMRSYTVESFWQVMPFLAGFFVLYSTMVFIHNLFNRTRSTLLDPLFLLANAGLFFAVSYFLVRDAAQQEAWPGTGENGEYGYRWAAAVSLFLTLFYIGHVWYCLFFRVLDRELLITFMGMAAFFLAITIPLVLSSAWITVSWSLQALVMLWIAGKLGSSFLRQISYLLYLLVIFRYLLQDLGNQYAVQMDDLDQTQFFLIMAGRVAALGIPIVSLWGGMWLLKRPETADQPALPKAADMAEWVRERWAARFAAYAIVGLTFVFLHLELNRTLGFLFPPIRLPVLTLLWIGTCCFLLMEYLATRSFMILVAMLGFGGGAVAKVFLFDLASWRLQGFVFDGGATYSFLEASMRLLDFGAMVLFMLVCVRWLTGDGESEKTMRKLCGLAALALLFIFLTLEVNTFLTHFLVGSQAGGVSILWSLFAIACLLGGIWKNIQGLRYLALILFAVVGWKVLFSDLAQLDPVYRIIAFLILGVLVLCGSFIYLKYRPESPTQPMKGEEPK